MVFECGNTELLFPSCSLPGGCSNDQPCSFHHETCCGVKICSADGLHCCSNQSMCKTKLLKPSSPHSVLVHKKCAQSASVGGRPGGHQFIYRALETQHTNKPMFLGCRGDEALVAVQGGHSDCSPARWLVWAQLVDCEHRSLCSSQC